MSPRGADDGSREAPMVPPAEFGSYYGRPVLKPPAWKDSIAYYFFLGGVSAGSSLLAAGGDLTGRPGLRRAARLASVVALGGGTYWLIEDLGRPSRFHHMLRVAKPTSPMSVGTWALSAFGAAAGAAAAAELVPRSLRGTVAGRLVSGSARPAGLAAAAVAPVVATYGAVLLSMTSVPAWKEAGEELPFVFAGSAAAASGGLSMILASPAEAGPARRLAVGGAAVELLAARRMEHRLGLVGEPYREGESGRLMRIASGLTAAGAVGSAALGRRSRVVAALSGAALLAGSLCTRLGVLRAGVASSKDPKYTVVPQRERLAQRTTTVTPSPPDGSSRPTTG